MNNEKVVLITGASSGIGKCCAQTLYKAGHKVYGLSRKEIEVSGYPMLVGDVTDPDSIENVVNEIIEREQKIDVLINSAGISLVGAVEDTSLEEASLQMNTNFFGTLITSKAVIPHMQKSKSGLIINVGSIAGEIGLKYQSIYSASKFAIKGFTESLRLELKPFNIKVTALEPGNVNTSIISNRIFAQGADENSRYLDDFNKTMKTYIKEETKGVTPKTIVKIIEKIMKKRNPRPYYLSGKRFERFGVRLKHLTPSKLFEKILSFFY